MAGSGFHHLPSSSGQASVLYRSPVCYVHHLPGAIPLASFMDRQAAVSYLACRPHPRHVVYVGDYSDLHIPIQGPYCSTSYVV